MAEVQVRAEEFQRLAVALKGADKEVVKGLRKELRTKGKPAGDRILEAIAERLPKRGGLADLVRSRGRATILLDLRSGVRIQLANRAGVYMGAFEAGYVRHPVWGNRKNWVLQHVLSKDAGADQFEAEAEELTPAIAEAMSDALSRALK